MFRTYKPGQRRIAMILLLALGAQSLSGFGWGSASVSFAEEKRDENGGPEKAECSEGLSSATSGSPVSVQVADPLVQATQSPAVQSIFSLKKPWRTLGHIIPVLPFIKTLKSKDRRFFVFVDSPFITGIPSTAASVILTKVLFWGLAVAFLGSHKPFPGWIDFDSVLKFLEVWVLYQGINIFRNGVTIDPTIPDNQLEWYKSEKFWLNYNYSAVGYGFGTQMIKPAFVALAHSLHGLYPDLFPAPPVLGVLDDAHKLGEKINAAAWPIFSQYMATYMVTPFMFGRWPKKSLMDEIRELEPKQAQARGESDKSFAQMVQIRDKKLELLEQRLPGEEKLVAALKALPPASRLIEETWPADGRKLADQLRKEAIDRFLGRLKARELARNSKGWKGKISRVAQSLLPDPEEETVNFAKVLKVAKFRAMSTRNAIQEAKSEKRWILYLTNDLEAQKGADIKKRKWAGMWAHKTAFGIAIALGMQSLYWGMRTVIAGDVATQTPTLLQRLDPVIQSTKKTMTEELDALEQKMGILQAGIEQDLESLAMPTANRSSTQNNLSEAQMQALALGSVRIADRVLAADSVLQDLERAVSEATANPGTPIEVDVKTATRLEAIQSQLARVDGSSRN